MKTLKHNNRRGWALLEAITALFILGLLFTAISYGVSSTGKANHYQHARQKCIAAAQAQLECVCLRNRPLTEKEITSLWPDVSLKVENIPGAGDWKNLIIIRVTAQAKTLGRTVIVSQQRYRAVKPAAPKITQTQNKA